MGFLWDPAKNTRLQKLRGISFEEIVRAPFIGIEGHPTRPHQHLLLFELNDYIWVVPCVIDETGIFLKTAFPSRRHNKRRPRGKMRW